jgi:probable phosphoglycerate mutase
MTKLYLIRHAEAEGNLFRRMHGQYNSRLTEIGLRQVKLLAKRLAEIPFDAVYTSDLCRTRQTAEAVTATHGLTARLDPRLREVAVGPWENRTFGDLELHEPEALEAFRHRPEEWRLDGAETWADYSARFAAALRDAAEAHPGGTVAVFSHGCVSSGGLHRILGIPHNSAGGDNTAVCLLRYADGRFSAEYLYDNSHLPAELSSHARQRRWRELAGGSYHLWFREPTAADRGLYDPDFLPPAGHETRIAMRGNEPIGCVCWRGDTVSLLWLRPDCRRFRLGDQLLGEAWMAMRASGQTVLRAGIPTANVDAISFLAHHGAVPEQMDDAYTVLRLSLAVPYPIDQGLGTRD